MNMLKQTSGYERIEFYVESWLYSFSNYSVDFYNLRASIHALSALELELIVANIREFLIIMKNSELF